MGYYVRVEPDVKIYVEDVNPEGKKTILFIHGWPANHKLFEYQFDKLPEMGYRCIGIDLRGFGSSDKPWRGYSYDGLADDIRSIVEVLKLKDFTLAGHSVGGAISIRYMDRHNGYGVSKLILIAASLRDESLFGELGKIVIPTLILHGIHDQVCPFPLAEAQEKGIKNSKLIAFESSGHGLFWEQRDKFNKELVGFIEG